MQGSLLFHGKGNPPGGTAAPLFRQEGNGIIRL